MVCVLSQCSLPLFTLFRSHLDHDDEPRGRGHQLSGCQDFTASTTPTSQQRQRRDQTTSTAHSQVSGCAKARDLLDSSFSTKSRAQHTSQPSIIEIAGHFTRVLSLFCSGSVHKSSKSRAYISPCMYRYNRFLTRHRSYLLNMSGPTRPSTTLPKPQQSPYIFLDIHDAVIQGLIHFTRQPEIGHSPFDTFDLWLYILNLGFPREQGFYTKFYHESPPKPEKEKTFLDERVGSASSDEDEDEDEDDGSGGIMIEVWKVEGYYAPGKNGGNVWVTTKNEVLLLFFCHESSWDMIEMPMSRLKKELRENVIPVSLSLLYPSLLPHSSFTYHPLTLHSSPSTCPPSSSLSLSLSPPN